MCCFHFAAARDCLLRASTAPSVNDETPKVQWSEAVGARRVYVMPQSAPGSSGRLFPTTTKRLRSYAGRWVAEDPSAGCVRTDRAEVPEESQLAKRDEWRVLVGWLRSGDEGLDRLQ